MSEHSKLPWKAREDDDINWRIQDAQCSRIAVDLDKDDAEFIVKAVNNHEEAVDIIRAIALHFQDTNSPLGEKANGFLKKLEQI